MVQLAFLEIIARLIIQMIDYIKITGAALIHHALLLAVLTGEAHFVVEELLFFFPLSFIEFLLDADDV